MTNVGADGGPQRASLAAAAAGAALIAAAIYASLTAREWVFAGLAGAAGLALWRRAFLGALPTAPLLDRRRRLRALRLSAQRLACVLAIGRIVGGRAAPRRRRRGGRLLRLPRRVAGGAVGRRAPAAADRGARPRRRAVPVQARRCARRRLAHGRDRRPGSLARGVSGESVRRPRRRAVRHERGGAAAAVADRRRSAGAAAVAALR